MILLAIDAATQVAGAALITDYTNGYIVLGEYNLNTRESSLNGTAPTHSETLLPLTDNLFKLTGRDINDVDVIACVSGPGSFTGLRIGAATATGLAKGANVPLVPVPTLCSLAYNIGYFTRADDIIVPVMDARRGQVYAAFYKFDNGKPEKVSDYLAADINEVLEILPSHRRALFLGDGADTYRDIITGKVRSAVFAPPHLSRQRAASTGICALRMLEDGFKPVNDFELLYVRKPQAVRDRERKERETDGGSADV